MLLVLLLDILPSPISPALSSQCCVLFSSFVASGYNTDPVVLLGGLLTRESPTQPEPPALSLQLNKSFP